MDFKKLIKSLLFIFVVVSLGVLVYKEFSPKNESNASDVTATKVDTVAVSGESVPAPENRSVKEPSTKQKEKALSPLSEVKAHNSRVIAYYFHGTFRCSTCQTIEKYSKEAIEYYFANELKNGTLEFRPMNIEEPENKHFIQDYQLVTRSLVLSLVSEGKETKWKNLPDVWQLVSDRDKFFQYVKDEVEKFHKET
ncbi:MAG: nitrophenyl compound nitroreductase subunit ArsF family protein [Thermodesulfovibrionales bacterium]|nr:nitrophenyl compound nitroreductase subunit ArsF family protein [Thermodesulfovibrionales bacterium]